MIAYERGAKGNSDGYTMLHATPSFALNTIVFKKLAYDLHRDFTPITNIAQGFGYLMLAYPSVQATNVKELIAFAKTQNKPLTYGTPGVGDTLHPGYRVVQRARRTEHAARALQGCCAGVECAARRRNQCDYSAAASRCGAGQGRTLAGDCLHRFAARGG